MVYQISEIFYSLSGEGISQGIPTVFVRFAGCSLRCGIAPGKMLWCDTGYALSHRAGSPLKVDEIIEKIRVISPAPVQVILTGGEPLEGENRQGSLELAKVLFSERDSNSYPRVRIETNGKEDIRDIPHAVFSLDYKLPGSGMEEFMFSENFQYLRERKNPLDEIKFVVRDREDFDKAIYMVSKWNLGNICLSFSPVQNELEPTILANWLKDANLPNSKFSFQLHKLLWGNLRGI